MVKIQVKRGAKASLPSLSAGEFGLTTDANELYIGTTDKNMQVLTADGTTGGLKSSQMPVNYATCSTAAATVAKTATVPGFYLKAGVVIYVKFTEANTAVNPTLNVNNTGAKPIQYASSNIQSGYIKANHTYELVYDGTNWNIVSGLVDPTIYDGSGIKFTNSSVTFDNYDVTIDGDPIRIISDGTEYRFTSGAIVPYNVTPSLGTSTYRYRNLYLSRGLDITPDNTSYAPTVTLTSKSFSKPNTIVSTLDVTDIGSIPLNIDLYLKSSMSGTPALYSRFQITTGSLLAGMLSNNAMQSGTINLGASSMTWNTIYADTGTIQTSDRSAKSDIHYLDEAQGVRMARSESLSESSTSVVSTQDVIDLVKAIKPATFVYTEEGINDIETASESNKTENIQLGIIADDIVNERLYNYIGAKMNYVVDIPEEKDEEGNIINPAYHEEGTRLGVKAVPLAVAALTVCKNLLSRVEELESKHINN